MVLRRVFLLPCLPLGRKAIESIPLNKTHTNTAVIHRLNSFRFLTKTQKNLKIAQLNTFAGRNQNTALY